MSHSALDNPQFARSGNDYFGAPFDHHTSFDGMNFGLSEEHGTPVVGIYAQDGIWDEEDSDSRTIATTMSNAKASGSEGASVYDRSLSSRVGSYRSRSNTITAPKDEEKQSGGWNWGRRPTAAGIASTTVPDIAPVPKLKEKKSKSMLRGKGRKGELSVMASAENQPSLPTPPLPGTPQSFLGSSPAMSTGSRLSPNQDMRIGESPGDSIKSKDKSSWTKGVKKIFRSKSSMALREITNQAAPPPLPSSDFTKAKHSTGLGKAFSSGAPAGATLESQRKFHPTREIPQPPTASSESIGIDFSQPANALADPFASSIDAAAMFSPTPSHHDVLAPPSRPKMPRNSPSLKDIKAFLTGPTKPKLSKAKSMANIKAGPIISGPMSAPPFQTTFDVPWGASAPKNISQLSHRAKSHSPDPVGMPELSPVAPNALQDDFQRPVESPPLLPPAPPFFPVTAPLRTRSSSLSLSSASARSVALSINTSIPLSSEGSSGPMTPPPTAPLPPLPAPVSVPLSLAASAKTSPIKRSASGALLLPRSRSTSMSLKSPPTSSSFFDLYEQLGIWPTPEKAKEATKPAPQLTAEATPNTGTPPTEATPPAPAQEDSTLPRSESDKFSAASWQAALDAFPVLDESMVVPENQGHTPSHAVPAALASVVDQQDEADCTMASNIAIMSLSPSSSATHIVPSTAGHGVPTTTAAADNAEAGPSRSRAIQRNTDGHGSGGSSRNSSRNRRSRVRTTSDPVDAWNSDEESAGEDDVPLSKLHPAALEAQKSLRTAAANPHRVSRRDRASAVMLQGRNPGGGTGWNGEGGIPSDVLANKLDRLLALQREQAEAEDNAPLRSNPTPPLDDAPVPPVMTRPSLPALDIPLPPIPAAAEASSSRPPASIAPEALPSPRLPPSPSQPTPLATLTRSNTAATVRSTRTRNRAFSNAASTAKHGMASDENMIRTTAASEPVPKLPLVHVKAFVGDLEGKKVTLELLPDTTPRGVIEAAVKSGDLGEAPPGTSWVLVELFAELGCERQIREYEPLVAIYKGWDAGAKYNCFIFRASNQALHTLQRAIPGTPPFLGSWVQYEHKKGKWQKRWLETRGGQVFLAKNEKNKEEIHINTSFFDIYRMTRPYPSPKPFVFVLKRLEPESAFENHDDYIRIFSAEEGSAWKFMAAIYDAKSYALQPTLRERQQHQNEQRPHPVRRPTGGLSVPALLAKEPLVNLKQEEPSRQGFTGKGLLEKQTIPAASASTNRTSQAPPPLSLRTMRPAQKATALPARQSSMGLPGAANVQAHGRTEAEQARHLQIQKQRQYQQYQQRAALQRQQQLEQAAAEARGGQDDTPRKKSSEGPGWANVW